MKSLIRPFQKFATALHSLSPKNGAGFDTVTNGFPLLQDAEAENGQAQMKKSISRMVRFPHLSGAVSRQCSTDDDKVRLLSIVSRSSLSDNVPLLAEDATSSSSSYSEDAVDGKGTEETPAVSGPHFSGINSPVGNQLIDVTDTASNRVVKTTQQAEEGKRHEWVFTLYDFDGKGTPNKEDILSIVRAIYDVLGSAKIRARNSVCDQNGARQTFGAFKIKLSLTADEDADVAVTKTIKNADEPRRSKRRDLRTSSLSVDSAWCGKMKGNEAGVTFETVANERHQSNNCSQRRNDDESPFLRHHKNPAKRRGGCAAAGAERYSPPLHNRKMYRRSVSISQQQVESQPQAACDSCTYRDYVNLSELENCCCSNGNHHDQQRHAAGVHHIRHCDRHCHCPAPEMTNRQSADKTIGCYRVDGKGGVRNESCLVHHPSPTTAVVRRCADIVQQTAAPACCRLLEPPAAPSNTSLRVNVQARAYYLDRTSAQSKIGESQRRFSASFEKENAPSLTGLAAESSIPVQQKKHKNREKQKKMRSMEQVRSWILNDSIFAPENPDCSPQANDEPRGTADGSDRLFVEHKHIHKHNHYHHHFY